MAGLAATSSPRGTPAWAWHEELAKLREAVPSLPPAARAAVRGVLESIVAECDEPTAAAVRSALAALEPVKGRRHLKQDAPRPSGPPVARRQLAY